MSSNDRKRARSDGAAQEQDGSAANTVSAATHSTAGPLRPRTVNTAQAVLNCEGAQGTRLQAVLQRSDACIGTATTHDAQISSDYAAQPGSMSQSHAAPSVRGKPQRPFRPAQSSVTVFPPSSSSVVSASRDFTAATSNAVHHAGTANARHNGFSANQIREGHSGTTTTSVAATPTHDVDAELHATWKAKRDGLEEEVRFLEAQSTQLTEETHAVEDAIERMLTEFEEDKRLAQVRHANTVARFHSFMKALRAREDLCLAAKQRALNNIDASVETVRQLCADQATTQEAIVLTADQCETLDGQLTRLQATVAERRGFLQQLQGEEERMKDAAYGLSGEVRELVLEMEQLKVEKRKTEVSAMQTEVARRELYSLCEALKGSIRVYCRVKGAVNVDVPAAAEPLPPATTTVSALEADTDVAEGTTRLPSPAKTGRGGSVESSVSVGVRSTAGAVAAGAAHRPGLAGGGHRSGRSTTRSSVTTAAMTAEAEAAPEKDGDGDAERPLFSYPDRTNATAVDVKEEEEVKTPSTADFLANREAKLSATTATAAAGSSPSCATFEGPEAASGAEAGLPCSSGRTITIHLTRSNATSTGVNNTEEGFTYDRVFPGSAHQEEVYRDVEPLVRNAVDGYRVCVFAYGQTGSGKTFTMEGDLRHTPAAYGVTPRALRTILQRQDELAREGWSYELSCTFIEIYNDVIRDLLQSGSARYETAMQQSGNPATYHTIKHSGDTTQITNVNEERIRNMEDFFKLYTHAVEQRSTAKTDLNDKSSRSHCIFTLRITGVNATIRQRSEGVLCLVDLAGSERVNESGAQGKQFKEAVNINRSLLDLGKCIRALRSGAVVPWRNCKLTYLLQNHLGAKGGKMLMIVTVSNLRQHAAESINSLRFAARVQETFVGTSVKRVVNMM
ncbi:putative C-terminal motor kinesin [Leptomonas pyrrhocoris]|uniref:Kinesin-like protein n=1 Tax=Leptomonas pyrrhocoris TaxID=157538 RepID=A0A0M9G940_LEPPY|nr:putative C-terminal motor kinesin [Leptomonas pyrrhocoris]KPA85273.1 putative C-terminal motor kinesin [Leptomonas pyrrhocoris]|eukprot:XP_015663712.1 putative C-terminal motor kinesin [Leptomonas pyrrhocoris]